MTLAAAGLRQKALAVLREGRCRVVRARSDELLDVVEVLAQVKGHRGVYAVDFQGGEWACTCQSEDRPCAHICAVQLVTGFGAVTVA